MVKENPFSATPDFCCAVAVNGGRSSTATNANKIEQCLTTFLMDDFLVCDDRIGGKRRPDYFPRLHTQCGPSEVRVWLAAREGGDRSFPKPQNTRDDHEVTRRRTILFQRTRIGPPTNSHS